MVFTEAKSTHSPDPAIPFCGRDPTKTHSPEGMCSNVHSSTVSNSEKLETAQRSIKGEQTQTLQYIHIMKSTTRTDSNMDESHKHNG